jgi:cytochrome c oxidase assembly protein subunit 19
MMSYLGCIKKVKGMNEHECRMLAKSYLACRMDRWVNLKAPPLFWCGLIPTNYWNFSNLMARDDFKNLGFQDKSQETPAKQGDGGGTGVKGELQW